MKILGEIEIQKLISSTHFPDSVPDSAEDRCFFYIKFLDSLDKEKIAEDSSFSLKEIWHSHYVWIKLYMKLYGSEAGWEDYASHVLERMDQELNSEIDWDFLEKAHNIMEDYDNMEGRHSEETGNSINMIWKAWTDKIVQI